MENLGLFHWSIKMNEHILFYCSCCPRWISIEKLELDKTYKCLCGAEFVFSSSYNFVTVKKKISVENYSQKDGKTHAKIRNAISL